MHGTFPLRSFEEKQESHLASLWTSIGFAVLPLIIAAVVAAFEHGRVPSLGDIGSALAAAATAAPL